MSNITLPSVLAFERKLETSDALMYAGNWDNKNDIHTWEPIPITKRQNRSTQSSAGIADDKKVEANPASSDSDDANLPQNKDTLCVSFSLRVIGNLGKPFTCNDPEFENTVLEKVAEFKQNGGIKTLADRYAYNIANGRFLWRNRVCAESVEIHVRLPETDEPLVFNAYDFSLNNFEDNQENAQLQALATKIAEGLQGDVNSFVLIKIDAYTKLGAGQHVFPSQQMNVGEKGKVLFQLDKCAAMHSVKVGNAIRTIDTWYGPTYLVKKGKNKVETVDIPATAQVPIAAEPYGSVTQRGAAYRPCKNDFYTLLGQTWLNGGDISEENKCYVVANIIRGGVFGGSGE